MAYIKPYNMANITMIYIPLLFICRYKADVFLERIDITIN